MRVDLRGKRWKLEVLEYLPDGSCGSIDPDGVVNKRILISSSQTPIDKLDTVIHECLHACVPDLDEDCVTETATGIAKVLHRMGCRIDL